MDNVGLLMHKLTKYQTLYAHGDDKSKKKVYGQKINYYTQKLTDMGMSEKNLAELGRLTGGAVTEDITANIRKAVETLQQKLKETSESQTKKQEEVNNRVVTASKELETVKTNYLDIVNDVVNLVTTVKTQLDGLAQELEKVKDVAATGIPETVDKLIKNARMLLNIVTKKNFEHALDIKINGRKTKLEKSMEPEEQARMKKELEESEPEEMSIDDQNKFLNKDTRNSPNPNSNPNPT